MAHKLQEILQVHQKTYFNDTIDLLSASGNDKALAYSQWQTLRMVEYYTNSRYLSGQNDARGYMKPFFNLVNANVDVSVVATDIDTKDMTLHTDKSNMYIRTFLLTHELRKWMNTVNFGGTLNRMGETRARYGGVLIKKVARKNGMNFEVVDWRNVITRHDTITDGLMVERHFMTPQDLYEKRTIWDADAVASLIKVAGKSDKGYVEVFELHGVLSDDNLGGSKNEYSRQTHILSYEGDKDGIYLYGEKTPENKYKFLPWEQRNGRGLGVGVVEQGEEAQVATNDIILKEKEALDLASKTVLSTTSSKIANNNLRDLDTGTILLLDQASRIDPVNLVNNAMPQLNEVMEKWFLQFERATSTYETQRGEAPPSGTPFRLGALVQQQSGSRFEYLREGMGIFLNEVFTDWILPDLRKKLNRQHTLIKDFGTEDLEMIDRNFTRYMRDKRVKEDVLNGRMSIRKAMERSAIRADMDKKGLSELGNRRELEIPKGFFTGVGATVQLITTGEQKNKTATMETLSSILESISGRPGMLQDPTVRKVFNRIIELSGAMSPLELESDAANQPPEVVAGGQGGAQAVPQGPPRPASPQPSFSN